MALPSRICALYSNARVILTPLSQRVWAGNGRSSIRVTDRLQGHEGRLSNISSLNGIKAFVLAKVSGRFGAGATGYGCSVFLNAAIDGTDLSMKKCVPCNSKDLRAMTEDTAKILIQRVPGWNLANENGTWKLHQSWKVKTFTKGMEFLRLVADVAEAEGHHPDLHLVGWNNVKIDIWTHAVGGLTENDFILAAKINGLNLHHLLRITPSNK